MTTSIRHTAGSVVALLLSVFLLSIGCASGGGGANDVPTGPSALAEGKKIGQLSISIGDGLAQDVVQVADQYSIVGDLDAGIRSDLGNQGWSDSGSISVDVEIVGLRVRSTSSAIWWGMMAGADTITVQVSVTENGQSIKSFQTGTSTALGGFVYGGRGKRITRMLNTLSKRITAGI